MRVWDTRTHRRSVGATTPIPTSFASNEAGMMTRDEYLGHLNPQRKWHPSDAYDFNTFELNEFFARRFVGKAYGRGRSWKFAVFASTSGMFFTKDDRPVGVLIDGILYHNEEGANIPDEYIAAFNNESTPLDIQQRQRVKYVEEYMPAVDDMAQYNAQKYPVVLRRFLSNNDEPLVLRAAESPIPNMGTNLAILDSRGRVLGVAQNEWGATLIAVAQEARGRGLGKVLSQVWYHFNPGFESGGMTSAGEALAVARWADRVREFRSRGWYSHLVRTGRMSPERVTEIVADLPPKESPRTPEQPEGELRPTGVPMIMSDGFSFITVYDRALLDDPDAFLQDPDERFIYGHAFLRGSPSVGVFVFSIDYDRPFAELTTRAILQLARNKREPLYDGDAYHDLLEGIEALPGVTRDGDYLIVTQDLLPLQALATLERQARRKVDPYRELEDMIMERADTKWR